MILLDCPYCGPRNASEFHYAGELSERPDPTGTTPGEWRTFLYLRDNPAGWTTETWFHRAGCRQHLVVERHTVTNEVRRTRLPDAGARDEEPATGGNVADDVGGGTF
ncbi:MAG: sarcosine oxidase subunit delta [Rubrobacteraceae bacterium]